MSDTNRPENERMAFCQSCGRPLTAEQMRNVGNAIFCEPCLVAKVAAADAGSAGAAAADAGMGGGPTGTAYGAAGTAYGAAGRAYGAAGTAYGAAGVPPRPYVPGSPNPVLAAFLGFIPGVGAFYNGQYAKGIVHLIIFAVLTSLSDRNGIFGLLIAGWVFYQVIEAHHTAKARRDGTPLPNPFGLNDIGERLGFGKAWPGGSGTATTPPPATGYGASGTGTADPASTYVPPAGPGTGTPNTGYGPVAGTQGPAAGYAGYPPPPPPSWGAPPTNYGFGAASAPPADGVYPPPPPTSSWSRVPTGAIILIALGVLFLLGNSGWLSGFPLERLIPFLLIGIGVWIFVRKMTETGAGLADDGTPAYRLRLYRAARGAVWVVLVGVLFLLDSFNILSWGRSWPLFIIVGGLMAFFERTAYSSTLPPASPYAYGTTVPPVDAAGAPVPSAAIVAASTPDREGN